MRIIFCLVILLIFSNKLYSQIDPSIASGLDMPISNSEMITRYRSLIMDNVIANNKEKTKELFNSLILKFDNEYYTSLYPSEKWILCFWLNDFVPITIGATAMDSVAMAKMDKKVKPKEDQLYQILNQTLDKEKDDFTVQVKNSTLSDEDKEFLLLILKTLTTPNNRDYQKTINSFAGNFISSYPNGKYEKYTKEYIRYEYIPKGFSFGMEFYTGAAFLNTKTSQYFKNGAEFGFGFIWGFGKLQLNTRGAFVFSRLKENIPYNNYTWENGQRAELFIPEMSFNYKFVLNHKTTISPILGLGWFSATPFDEDKKKNSDLDGIEINSGAAPIMGIEISHEYPNQYYYNYFYHKPMYGFYSWNLRYEIQRVPFDGNYSKMNGLMHNIVLSFKFGLGGAKRKY
ncbi:MAG: hypothetical protein WCP85_06120 [Mariniphaga sp.]